MSAWLPWCNLLLTLPGVWVVARIAAMGSDAIRGTTLVGPSRWVQVALIFWIVAQSVALPEFGLSAGIVSRMQMFALSLLLAPFVSVLGAKRPGARVWDIFIVLPML